MGNATYRCLVIVAAVALSFSVAACADAPSENSEGAVDSGPTLEEAGEHQESEGGGEAERRGSEGEGEHGGSESEGEHGGEGGRRRSEGEGEHRGSEGEGEHGEEGGHAEGEEGEESGVYIGRNETWDVTRRGARLVLSFSAARNAFVGTVENTTEQPLCAVRVEVHLDTPEELGPTERTDLRPGATIEVELPTGGESFETWTAHPEASRCSGDL